MKTDMSGEIKNMLNLFDEILFKHFERLIGSRYGVGELPLNSVIISLIMLLMERENEIESFPSDETDRYAKETLICDFEELGCDSAWDLNVIVEQLIQKGYIHVDGARLIPQKPMISMARLIDMAFPKMPGMNFVAYFIQSMDEVKSKRKDLSSAADQFDQVLKIQGVPLKKSSQQSELSKLTIQSYDKETHIQKFERQKTISPGDESKPSIIFGRKTSNNFLDHSKEPSSEPKVLSSDTYKGKIEIRKVDFGKPSSEATEPVKENTDKHKNIEDEKSISELMPVESLSDEDDDIETSATNGMIPSEKQIAPVFDEQRPGVEEIAERSFTSDSDSFVEDISDLLESTEQNQYVIEDTEEDSIEMEPSQKIMENEKIISEGHPEKGLEKETASTEDGDIDKRISAFEEDLALQCPICTHSKVIVQNTATGKPYYKCSNKECNFISWGKPHHISCQKCNNPFLIETSNKAGHTILKCPRATCRYRKKVFKDTQYTKKDNIDSAIHDKNKVISISQKPRRKVVRRRVVRRKK